MAESLKLYPSDVTGEEWSRVALYLTLMTEDTPQRDHPLRELFNGLRYVVNLLPKVTRLPATAESVADKYGTLTKNSVRRFSVVPFLNL